ncbi:hypothetical protein SPFM14_00262 [Salmonella phage SPFM14]|nr:hypothetical protein SPFM14_00262 [Salmonella phage SPFM14]
MESHTGKVKTQLAEGSRDTLLLTHMPADLLARNTLKMYGEKHENDFRQFDVFLAGGQDKMTPNQLHYNALEHAYLCSYRSANKVFPEASFKNKDINNLTATARAVAPSVLCVHAFEENRERLTPDVMLTSIEAIHSYQEIYLNLRTLFRNAFSLAFEGLLHTGEYADWKGELRMNPISVDRTFGFYSVSIAS